MNCETIINFHEESKYSIVREQHRHHCQKIAETNLTSISSRTLESRLSPSPCVT